MKKLFIPALIIFIFMTVSASSAQTPTVKITPVPTTKITPFPTTKITPIDTQTQQNQIEKIKDLVASKVAELKLVDKRGIIGTVKSSSNSEIKVIDLKKQEKQIEIDELTKFQSSTEDEGSFGISDIKTGDVISSIGLFNKATKKLLARFVSRAANIPQSVEGVVTAKDLKAFTFDMVGEDGKKKTVSVETSTKTSSVDEGKTLKSGFTKIEVDQRVIVVGFDDPKIKAQLNASRILFFLSIPPSAEMKKFQNISNNEAPVSTGSAGKVAPITR